MENRVYLITGASSEVGKTLINRICEENSGNEKNIKIYAYGHSYSDGGGSSGKNIKFSKYNGETYEDYKTCSTDYSGNRYELVTLEPGKYKVTPEAKYVTFDEWEVEVIQ